MLGKEPSTTTQCTPGPRNTSSAHANNILQKNTSCVLISPIYIKKKKRKEDSFSLSQCSTTLSSLLKFCKKKFGFCMKTRVVGGC
ncbi:unnamed protein product [Prunus brigantina]